VVVVVAAIVPAAALAAAAVSLSGGQLTVTVQSGQTHGILIEPFEEQLPPSRRGFRVRQDTGGRPAFTSSDGDCFVNQLANDVVCAGTRSSIRVNGGAGVDLVTVIEAIARPPVGEPQGCVEFPGEPFPVVARLGGGADVFSVELLGCTLNQVAASFSYGVDVDGGAGADRIAGGKRNDTLGGGAGNDNITGGAGGDSIAGGADNDTIRARDGVFDTISCGTGTDTVEADLADFFDRFVRNRNGFDCESIDTFAVDDGPPARAVGRSLAVVAGAARATVACPRNARTACRGTLSARLGGIRGRVLAQARYSARLGGRATVSLRLGNLRTGTRIVLETSERGVSKKGPRSATRVVLVR
jgi:RTX calcium-binding nonapeptide repeat (4 copies)